MANFELLDAALGYIEAHPKEHDQNWFGMQTECGTTMCVAGHAAALAGAEIKWGEGIFGRQTMMSVRLPGETQWRHPASAGQKVLDLTDEQASELFYCFGDLDELKNIVKDWANEQ